MRTNIVKWGSIAALLLAALFWNSAAKYQLFLNVVVCATAVTIAVQAVQEKKPRWAAGFLGMALLFNPALPAFPLAGGWGFLLTVLSIAPFAISLRALKPRPLLSVPSITDRNPGSVSL